MAEKALTEYPSKGIEIENLVVNPRMRREIAVGDHDSFKRISEETTGISAILWNEECISLVTRDPSTIVTFRPELNPTLAMFFTREEKRMGGNFLDPSSGTRVWEGDYSPIKFTKSNLIKFLKQQTTNASVDLVGKIKEMKIHERHVTTENMISLEDDNNVKSIEEKELTTNIPTKFTLEVPLIQTPDTKYLVTLDFEAQVIKEEDPYARQKGTFIQLRCLNSREVLRKMMFGLISTLPKALPRYYGRLYMESSKNF